MAQIFHPSTNTIARVSILGGLFILAVLSGVAAVVVRSPYFNDVGVAFDQPVPFSHQHHVAGVGIDCRYCHTGVEDTAFAGIPSTKTCMNCHSVIWSDSPTLEPVRASFRENRPIRWARVHDLPDYVYFDHGIHVRKGVGCATCHGRVDRMPLTWKTQTLHMEWCLECHRRPEGFLRPREQVFDMEWEPPMSQSRLGAQLAEAYDVQSMMNCSTCHR